MNKSLKTIATLRERERERVTLLNNGNVVANDLRVVHKNVGAAASCPQGKGICTIHRREKGITLIALIVTIIVLLILAMTTVSLVLRENLIKKAQLAKDEYEQAAQTESDQLNELENYLLGNNIELTKEQIETLIPQYLYGQNDDEKESAKEQLRKGGLNVEETIFLEYGKNFIYFPEKEILYCDDESMIVDVNSLNKDTLNELYKIAGLLDEKLETEYEQDTIEVTYEGETIIAYKLEIGYLVEYKNYTLFGNIKNGEFMGFVGI